ncbi:MAG TPA: hypothetical protein VFZ17_10790 [Acidimicrobiia bacterium]|nr:hypothetical protein [Acidimicrobiia bacterium]
MRLLWHTVRVDADADVLDALLPLLPQAEHPMPPLAAMHYTAMHDPGGGDGDEWLVTEEGDELARVADAAAAAEAVYVRMHRRAFELASRRGWSRVHGSTVDLDGHRVVLVGRAGVGKTTLALRLLYDGADVQGDESVLVRADGTSLAVPRAFHVKAGTDVFVPELRALAPLPTVEDVRVVDPRRARSPWVLTEAPVAHVVLLERGSGRVPSIEAVGGAELLEELVQQSFPLTEGKAGLVRTLVGALSRARGHRVTGGDPAATVSALRAVLR